MMKWVVVVQKIRLPMEMLILKAKSESDTEIGKYRELNHYASNGLQDLESGNSALSSTFSCSSILYHVLKI